MLGVCKGPPARDPVPRPTPSLGPKQELTAREGLQYSTKQEQNTRKGLEYLRETRANHSKGARVFKATGSSTLDKDESTEETRASPSNRIRVFEKQEQTAR